MSVFYVDGRFLPADQASLPLNDLALLRGYGVFDFLRSYRGIPLHLPQHIKRLQTSAHLIGIKPPWPNAAIEKIVLQTLDRNGYPDANIRILITGGSSSDFILPENKPRLIVMVTPVQPMPEQWYTQGVKIITTAVNRNVPEAKSINYIPAIMALQTARRSGAIEAVYADTDGMLLEGTTSNIFAINKGALITPGKDTLAGITRKIILELAAEHFTTEVRRVSKKEFSSAREVFLTASNKEVVPVIKIDDTPIADGKPGPGTKRIMSLYKNYIANYT